MTIPLTAAASIHDIDSYPLDEGLAFATDDSDDALVIVETRYQDAEVKARALAGFSQMTPEDLLVAGAPVDDESPTFAYVVALIENALNDEDSLQAPSRIPAEARNHVEAVVSRQRGDGAAFVILPHLFTIEEELPLVLEVKDEVIASVTSRIEAAARKAILADPHSLRDGLTLQGIDYGSEEVVITLSRTLAYPARNQLAAEVEDILAAHECEHLEVRILPGV